MHQYDLNVSESKCQNDNKINLDVRDRKAWRIWKKNCSADQNIGTLRTEDALKNENITCVLHQKYILCVTGDRTALIC